MEVPGLESNAGKKENGRRMGRMKRGKGRSVEKEEENVLQEERKKREKNEKNGKRDKKEV